MDSKWVVGTLITIVIFISGFVAGSYKYTYDKTQDMVKKDDLWRLEDNLKTEINSVKIDLIREMDKTDHIHETLGIPSEGPPYRPRIEE